MPASLGDGRLTVESAPRIGDFDEVSARGLPD